MDEQPEQQRALTPEEITQRKKEMEEYYDTEIPFLTKQLQYEMIITQLEEARARRCTAQLTIANIMAKAPEEPEEPKEESKERKLKKD